MAIYDDNGTAKTEIGKVYDNDGTTGYQIGKVYDSDGTTNSLIYQANYVVVDSATGEANGSWTKVTYNDVTSSFSLTNKALILKGAAGGDYYYVINKTPINASEYTKAYVTFSSVIPDNPPNPYNPFIGLTASSQPSFNLDSTSTVTKYTLPQGTTTNTTTYTFNISNISGNVYPIVFIRNYSAASITITKWYFE